MAVLVPGKFVYLATPHTGSMSTSRGLLAHIPGAVSIGEHHAVLSSLGVDVTPVTTVRNPYDLIVTWWLRTDAKWTYSSFKGFLREYDHPTYVQDGRIFYHCNPGVEVLRFENLQRELSAFLICKGLEPFALPWINRTVDRKPWGSYYDREGLEIVWERFGQEAARYGYARA